MSLLQRDGRRAVAVMMLVEIGLERIWERPWIGRSDDARVKKGGLMSELNIEVVVKSLCLLNMIPNSAM